MVDWPITTTAASKLTANPPIPIWAAMSTCPPTTPGTQRDWPMVMTAAVEVAFSFPNGTELALSARSRASSNGFLFVCLEQF